MTSREDYAMLDARPRLTSLHLDSSAFMRADADDYPPDSAVSLSPSSTAPIVSPITPLRPHSPQLPEESGQLEGEKESASGPRRSKSSPGSKSEKEKRKRSRVTPDQLVHLEGFFAIDRSPTAARRREISDFLGMQERQTQIWFQNRRAKAKLQDGKHKSRSSNKASIPASPPELAAGFEIDLHNLIHENEPVTIIPCTDLSIGTWRRIATTVGKHDLVAYVCDTRRCLTWFIHSAGYGFKMEIPFDTISDTVFTNAAPGSGLATFELSEPPLFYLENISSPAADGSVLRFWKRCADWTEGHQASTVLRHDLIGSAPQLAHIVHDLKANNQGPDIALHSPVYRTDQPASPMELPPPPMAGLAGPNFLNQTDDHIRGRSLYHGHTRKRSFSGPPAIHCNFSSGESDTHSVNSASSTTYSRSPYSPAPLGHSSEYSPSDIYDDYPRPMHNAAHFDPYRPMTVSHGIAPRPYSAQPVPRTFYENEPRLVQPYHNAESMRRHSSATLSQQYGGHYTPSPPLLTTPYHPPIHSNDHLQSPIASGLPGVPYESDEELHYPDSS